MAIIKAFRLKRYFDEPQNNLENGNMEGTLCLCSFFPHLLIIPLTFNNRSEAITAGGSNQRLLMVYLALF